jgi:hypothetical protein
MTYVKDWEKAKKDFKTTVVEQLKAGGDEIPDEYRSKVVAFLKAETGMTPALKDVDSAFDKKHRKSVMQALTKVHAVIEKAAMAAQKIALGAGSLAMDATDDAAADALGKIQTAGLDFKRALLDFETRISKELGSLQEAKSATGDKIEINTLEGDMEGAVNRFKNVVKPHAALEKQHKVLDSMKPMIKAMKAYSTAAARTKVGDAITSLEDFFTGVDKLSAYSKSIAKLKPALDDDYVEAVENLAMAMRAIKTTRGAVSHKQLEAMQKAGK